MSKWQDTLKKTLNTDNNGQVCHCSSDRGLFVPNRFLSAIIAGLLFLNFSIFMAGYFLGKKKIIEQFVQKAQQDAFSDHIYTKFVSADPQQYDQKTSSDTSLIMLDDNNAKPITIDHDDINLDKKSTVQDFESHRYYAQLIGFVTEKAAQAFSKKMCDKGIETEVKKRTSKTAKGRTSYWYQVITPVYSNRDELSALIDRISNEENIKDARIQIC